MIQAGYGVVCWYTFYMLIKKIPIDSFCHKELTRNQDVDLRNRMVSVVHGILAIIICGSHFFEGGAQCGEVNTDLQRKAMIMCMSYFTYDTISMAVEGLLDVAMSIHHPLCIFGMIIPLYENRSANYLMLALFMAELSNPAMHLR